MASYPGPTLEDFIGDLYFHPVPEGTLAKWEPHREEVERALERYVEDGGDETQSWRDWRNSFAGLFNINDESGAPDA